MNRSLGPFLLLLLILAAAPRTTAQSLHHFLTERSLNHYLLRAAAQGDTADVAWAVERGADVNACVRLDPYAADLLISDTVGGLVAHQRLTLICLVPLSAALLNGHPPVVRMLLDNGAAPEHGAELSFGGGMTRAQEEALRLYLNHLSDGGGGDSLIDDPYDRKEVAISYLMEGHVRNNDDLIAIASEYLTPAEAAAVTVDVRMGSSSGIDRVMNRAALLRQAARTAPDTSTAHRAFELVRTEAGQSGSNVALLDHFRRNVAELLPRYLEPHDGPRLSDEERKEYYRIIYDALRNDHTLDGRPGILPWLARVAADRSGPSRRDDDMIIGLMAERVGKEDVAEVSNALAHYITELSHPERQIGGYDTASVEKVIALLRRHGGDPWIMVDPSSGKRSASDRSAPLWYVLLSRPATWPAGLLMEGMTLDSAFEGLTPLHVLVGTSFDDARHAIPLIRWLRDRGADINRPGVGGVTPLYLSLAHAPHLMSEQESRLLGTCTVPLDASSIDAYELLISFLLEKGAGPNRGDENGLTPLHLAAANASPSIVRALLDTGADPDAATAGGVTPLMLAARRKNGAIVRLLADDGGDPTQRDADDRTLLHALFRADLDTIGKRLSGRVRESIFGSFWCRVPALTGRDPRIPPLVRTESHYLFYSDEAADIVPLLVDAGVDPNGRDRDGRTALHLLAVESLHVESLTYCYYGDEAHIDRVYAMIVTLLESGADIEAVDRFGLRPLHYAALSGSPCLMELMLEAGADPDARTADERRLTAAELRELIQ